MIARYMTSNKQITFEVEGSSDKEIFDQLAAIQEVFDAEHQCGMPDCKSTHIRFMRRSVIKGTKTFEFFHLSCRECYARFDFGQSADGSGGLFPKRKDKDGNYLPNNGWSRYSAGNQQQQGDVDPWG